MEAGRPNQRRARMIRSEERMTEARPEVLDSREITDTEADKIMQGLRAIAKEHYGATEGKVSERPSVKSPTAMLAKIAMNEQARGPDQGDVGSPPTKPAPPNR